MSMSWTAFDLQEIIKKKNAGDLNTAAVHVYVFVFFSSWCSAACIWSPHHSPNETQYWISCETTLIASRRKKEKNPIKVMLLSRSKLFQKEFFYQYLATFLGKFSSSNQWNVFLPKFYLFIFFVNGFFKKKMFAVYRD